MPTLYVVTMHRWGDIEAHGYVLGVFDDLTRASEQANEEQLQRGNKYEAQIVRCEINEAGVKAYIRRLPCLQQ